MVSIFSWSKLSLSRNLCPATGTRMVGKQHTSLWFFPAPVTFLCWHHRFWAIDHPFRRALHLRVSLYAFRIDFTSRIIFSHPLVYTIYFRWWHSHSWICSHSTNIWVCGLLIFNYVKCLRDLLIFSFIIDTSLRPLFVPNWFRSTALLHISVITTAKCCLIGIFSKWASLPFNLNNPFILVVALDILSMLHLRVFIFMSFFYAHQFFPLVISPKLLQCSPVSCWTQRSRNGVTEPPSGSTLWFG